MKEHQMAVMLLINSENTFICTRTKDEQLLYGGIVTHKSPPPTPPPPLFSGDQSVTSKMKRA